MGNREKGTRDLMMNYRLRLSRDARKYFPRLDTSDMRKISAVIDALAVDPRPHGSVKPAGYETIYRVRKGEYRIVYEIVDDEVLVFIIRIGRRKDIYRNLLK